MTHDNDLLNNSLSQTSTLNQPKEPEKISPIRTNDTGYMKNCNHETVQKSQTNKLLTLTDDSHHFYFAHSLLYLATENPTQLTNPYWQSIIANNLSPYDVQKKIGTDIRTPCYDSEQEKSTPLWGMCRMGQSTTILPDGREVLIGGEYDDFYDPHFYIYNDVIVKHPDGSIDIFGYPNNTFLPTDFHSATLVNDTIWIIGSVGNPEDRQFSQTQVYKLNIHSFKICKVETVNSMGWVSSHSAYYQDGQIIIKGGRLLADNRSPMIENYDDWSFNLTTLIWTNLTNKRWQKFYVGRKDNGFLNANSIRGLDYYKCKMPERYEKEVIDLTELLGKKPDEALAKQLYSPPIAHIEDSTELDYNQVAIVIDDIRVRYVDKMTKIFVYIEGELATHKVNIIKENLKHKLEKLENSPCVVVDF